jgi:hypothetical protein
MFFIVVTRVGHLIVFRTSQISPQPHTLFQ